MANVLPGASSVGYGFNIYGDASMASRTLPLFDMSGGSEDYTLGDKTYNLPDNAHPEVVDEPATFELKSFESAQEFVQDIKTSASIASDIGGFEGSATVKYDKLTKAMKNVVLFALSDVRPYFTIDLKSRNLDKLTSDAASAINALPASYTAATEQAFFAFFRKYGMYFVKSVTMGGRLTYYSAMEKRENETTEQLEAQAKGSYGGLTGDASATWSSVGKARFASSKKSIETLPPGSLNSADPQFGEDLTEKQGYQDWSLACREAPGIIAFHLTPMADLFPHGDPKHDALLLAQEDFGNCYIYTEASHATESPYPGRISVGSVPLKPANWDAIDQRFNVGRVWQVIVDRHTFEVRLNKAYGLNWHPKAVKFSMSGDMLGDILPFNTPDYILVIASKWHSPPQKWNFCVSDDITKGTQTTPKQQRYFEILRNAGAGPQLDSFLSPKYTTDTYMDAASYVFVGVLGHKTHLSREASGYSRGGGGS